MSIKDFCFSFGSGNGVYVHIHTTSELIAKFKMTSLFDDEWRPCHLNNGEQEPEIDSLAG